MEKVCLKGESLMSVLNVTNLSHGFGDRAIFENVSFRLLKGEHVGLVGANGEGKSTFMNIITGKLAPDEGKVEWSRNVRVGYLDQHVALQEGMTIRDVLKTAFQYLFDMEAKINDLYMKMGEVSPEEMDALLEEVGVLQDILTNNDFYVIDAKVEEVAKGLGLQEIGLERDVTELSGGQRSKVLLAKLLLEKPDILLLDEPTNHLDEAHITWLTRYLQEYENAFILISHDIPFLNSVINLIYHMANQELNRYVGDYDNFVRIYEAKKAQLESAYKKQQQEIADLKDFVARNKARPKPEFNFKVARTAGRYIFETKDLVIGYDEPLSAPLNLTMERGQKIAICGANGIGKTTLLRSILGEIPAISGSVELGEHLHIGYFEQEIKGGKDKTCLQEFWDEFPHLTQGEARAALAKCGLTTKHIESKVMVLSAVEGSFFFFFI